MPKTPGHHVVVSVGDRLAGARLARQMRRRGHVVDQVDTGAGVLAAVAEHRPAAVLLDWLLPGVSGVEVCARLRGLPHPAPLRIVLIAARGDRDQIAAGFAAGADEVLTRPLDAGHVARVLAAAPVAALGRSA